MPFSSYFHINGASLFASCPNTLAVTTIQFSLPQKDIISIKVYDIRGRELGTIVHDIAMAGKHIFKWDAGDLSSGIYFIRMESRHFVNTKKVSLIK